MDMEKLLMDARKGRHEAIAAAVSDFDRLGYLVRGIRFEDDALEVICYPPKKEGSGKSKSA